MREKINIIKHEKTLKGNGLDKISEILDKLLGVSVIMKYVEKVKFKKSTKKQVLLEA